MWVSSPFSKVGLCKAKLRKIVKLGQLWCVLCKCGVCYLYGVMAELNSQDWLGSGSTDLAYIPTQSPQRGQMA